MRILMLMIIMAGTFTSSFARQEYVVAKEENTPIYRNRLRKLYEQSVFTISPDEQVRVLKREGRHLRVENSNRQHGWVEVKHVLPVAASKKISFDDVFVEGYINNPDPAIIFGSTDPEDNMIKLDRSFRDALRENVDRETVMRQTAR